MAHYIQNTDKNGIEIYFDGKPSEDILTKLKENKWRWFPSKRCWYNRYSSNNELFAKIICLNESIGSGNVEDIDTSVSKKQKRNSTSHEGIPLKDTRYKTSALKKDCDIIERDLETEELFGITDLKFYYYQLNDGEIYIIGEVYADTPLIKSFQFTCTLYDEDGDIIESSENENYSGKHVFVTNSIRPKSYFDGFPFSFNFYGIKEKICKIKILPTE